MDRRRFISNVVAGIAGPFAGVACAGAKGGADPVRGYGPLRPVRDLRDGKARLHLPDGFRYRSFSVAGDRYSDGSAVPGKHDGMAAFSGPGGSAVLIRNHEVNGPVGAFGDRRKAYDPMAGGGTSTLQVTRYGEVIRSAPSLNGTMMNCSGGPMAWRAWVTCEETVNGPDVANDRSGEDNSKLTRKHGYLFEVPVARAATATPIRSAGRFPHESAAFDPSSGAVYLTEDNFSFPSGFYRYLPPKHPILAGRLLDGGRLQMLAVEDADRADLSKAQEPGAAYGTAWVDIDDPDPDFTGRPAYDEAAQAVGRQGRKKGAAIFARLEGAVHHHGTVYFVSTQGGATAPGERAPDGFGDGRGQVWAYETWSGRLKLVYESPRSSVLDLPDNVTVSRRGTLVLCEDGEEDNYLRGLTKSGDIFDFCRLQPIEGDGGAEFAGTTFGPGGHTLYVNLQAKQGMSIAIWGPWERGPF
ncbi:secreted PhoX family phosphatase [Nonomuraea thailandensis]|uniref:Secreted PhoX family phosphatase n=1 Tax=Nonomuraea thailandensis TaxID=1188745 RepID=A0A9X2K9U2_9ACTN|nr:alkaline phosphatase PhoX [Nonomuraea thailandensis]MCP2362186.1 secreted PhoX family phosphatase [Nonomuraea thailandensis]